MLQRKQRNSGRKEQVFRGKYNFRFCIWHASTPPLHPKYFQWFKVANFSPLFLMLSRFRTSQQAKNNAGTMNKSASVVCKYDCTIPFRASLALLLIPPPLPHATAEPLTASCPGFPHRWPDKGHFEWPQHAFLPADCWDHNCFAENKISMFLRAEQWGL